MKSFFKELFCKHEWNSYCYNIVTENKKYITIGFQDCHKCAASKLKFLFGNESRKLELNSEHL